MIYENDANANSKDSRKSRDPPHRHSFLDEVALENEPGLDLESFADSDRKRSSTQSKFAPQSDDIFRQKLQITSMKDAAAASSSSMERMSQGHDPMSEGDQDGGLLDQISVANPDSNNAQFVKDLRNLKINEKSEDTGSLGNATTPKDFLQMSSGGERKSKVTSPLDNNASYIDKSMTRQFDNLQQTPSLSQNTVSQQNIDQFDSRK